MEIKREEIDEIFNRWYEEFGRPEDREGATDTFLEYLEEIRSEQ